MKKDEKNNKSTQFNLAQCKIDWTILIATILVFGGFAIFCEMQECGDSFQYLNQYPMREPVYALLLQLLQFIFGEGYGLPLAIVQNLSAIICVYWTYRRVSDIFDFGNLTRFLTGCVLLSPHILTPLGSRSHLVLTCSVMTEGISISLYYVWFAMMLGILTGYYKEDKRKKAEILSLLMALLLVLTRGQMMVGLIVWFLVTAVRALMEKRYKTIIIYLAAMAVMFPLKDQLSRWYNLAETGNYVATVSSKPMLLANVVYVADEEDAQYIEEENLREAFASIVASAKQDGLCYEAAPAGMLDRALYHEDCHDSLNFDYVDPAIRQVIYEADGIDEENFLVLMIREDELCGQIASEVLPHIAGKFLKNYVCVALLGFIRSVAIEKSILPYVALILYICAVGLMIYSFIKAGSLASKPGLSMLLTLVAICGTVLGTSIMIQCIGRYMIYNLPFFYICGMALLKEILPFKKAI